MEDEPTYKGWSYIVSAVNSTLVWLLHKAHCDNIFFQKTFTGTRYTVKQKLNHCTFQKVLDMRLIRKSKTPTLVLSQKETPPLKSQLFHWKGDIIQSASGIVTVISSFNEPHGTNVITGREQNGGISQHFKKILCAEAASLGMGELTLFTTEWCTDMWKMFQNVYQWIQKLMRHVFKNILWVASITHLRLTTKEQQ